MKNKKMMKVISFVTVLLMVMMMVMPVFATGTQADNLTDPTGIKAYKTNASDTANDAIGTILGVVQVVAAGVAVIMLIVLAIKYISASPEGKADIKKSAAQYVVGAVLLFGASGILGLVRGFALDITNKA